MNTQVSLFQPTLTREGLERLGLSLFVSKPCAALKGIVHSYLQIRASKPTIYPIIPDGTQSVFISMQGIIVGGAQEQARDIQIFEAGEYFGIRFHSGALRHFFKVDASDITNAYVNADYLPCKQFPFLYQMIYQTCHYQARVKLCENWLLEHFSPQANSPFDHALQIIHQTSGNVKIAALANKVGWSSRHLNRIFQQHTGLCSKTFSKVIRMQSVCRQLSVNPSKVLDTALGLGFFDQSHLIKNFKTHLTPILTYFPDELMSDSYNL